jgi:uncharacterized protein (TIGR01777 family)
VPVLLGWAAQPTSLQPAYHGILSILAAAAAVGVTFSGWRDLHAAARIGRLPTPPAAELFAAVRSRQHVLVTGATGFIGRRLVETLTQAGHDVTVHVRDLAKAKELKPPFRIVTDLDQVPDHARLDAVINLAGEPIANALWSGAKRRRILRSRLRMTRDVVRLIERLTQRPSLLVSGSAIGWYGLWQDEVLSEGSGGRPGFTHRLCAAWEQAARRAEGNGTRVVCLRIGLVLGIDGGLLSRLLTPFDFGLGGPLGSGRQWMSWIERDDLVRLIAHVIATPALSGPVNATAPMPVVNAVFARELGAALGRPAVLRLPAAVLHLVGGELADELFLGGQRVVPEKALSSAFTFRHERLGSALAALVGGRTARRPGHRSGWAQALRDVSLVLAKKKL